MAKKSVDNSDFMRRLENLELTLKEYIQETRPFIEAAEDLRAGGRLAAKIAGVMLAVGSFLLVYKNLFFGAGNPLFSLFGNKS